MVANIAVPSAIELVEEICQLLLEALSPYAPEQVEEEERIRDFTSDLRDAERLYYLVEHLRQIVTLAEALVAKLGPAPEKPDRNRRALERALTLAHKVLRDREDPKAKDRLRSVTDPDARQGKHGNYFDGYLVDALVDADSEIITALEVLPGNGDEGADSANLLRQEEGAQGNDVEAISTDGILSTRGEVVRKLEEEFGVTVYAPPPRVTKEAGFFPPEAFTLDERGEELTCPAGEKTSVRYPNRHGTGWRFAFRRSQCKDCAFQSQCMARLPEKHGRVVIPGGV